MTRAPTRRDFPLLSRRTYLASHSLGAVPKATLDALTQYYQEWAELGILAWDGPWWAAVEGFGRDIERLIGAREGTVVGLPNATRAMAAATSAMRFQGGRDTVVTTDLEFTTTYPFLRSLEAEGAKIRMVRSADGIQVPASDIVDAIDERTALVLTGHAYFRSGAVQDLGAISRAAHKKGAWVLGDGYQSVGCVPIDVQEMQVDFFVGGSHKWLCGGPGAGYLYVRKELISRLEPKLTGWFGLKEPFSYERNLKGGELHPGILRFLDGTPNVPGLYAAREGIKAVLAAGPAKIRRRSLATTQRIIDWADERGLEVRTPRSEARNGMVCLQFPGSKEATQRLIKQGIIVDWRPDCGLRASPHFYNDERDLDTLFAALAPLVGARARGARPKTTPSTSRRALAAMRSG